MPGFDDEVESGRRIDQDFSREEWRFKAKMVSSEYKERITSLINQYDFTQSCKIQLSNIIHVAFDPNVMLARNPETESRKMRLEIELNIAKVAYAETDVQNPGLINVEQAIIDAFGDFVSPSIGGKERDRITKQESVTHSSYSGLPNSETAPKRGGFKLPWRKEE
jgi:hypothetical protein